MSTTINGLKKLDENYYERILIRKKEDNYKIEVRGNKSNYMTLESLNKISNYLKNETDSEKIRTIIEYFLRYTTINEISDRAYLDRHDGKFLKAGGSKELYLQIPKKDEFCDIPNMIAIKYFNDRLLFCEENKDINFIELHVLERKGSYERTEYNFGTRLNFNLMSEGFKLVEEEKIFLKEFILEKFKSIGKPAYIRREEVYIPSAENYIELGDYLTCGHFRMKLCHNTDVINAVTDTVYNYNESLIEAKKKQLKMEGF